MSNSQMEVMMVQINKRGKDERQKKARSIRSSVQYIKKNTLINTQKKTIKIEFLLECNEWDKIEIHGLP